MEEGGEEENWLGEQRGRGKLVGENKGARYVNENGGMRPCRRGDNGAKLEIR